MPDGPHTASHQHHRGQQQRAKIARSDHCCSSHRRSRRHRLRRIQLLRRPRPLCHLRRTRPSKTLTQRLTPRPAQPKLGRPRLPPAVRQRMHRAHTNSSKLLRQRLLRSIRYPPQPFTLLGGIRQRHPRTSRQKCVNKTHLLLRTRQIHSRRRPT